MCLLPTLGTGHIVNSKACFLSHVQVSIADKVLVGVPLAARDVLGRYRDHGLSLIRAALRLPLSW